jgi:hypothetical protein
VAAGGYITSVSPDHGPAGGGTVVDLYGTNFAAANSVYWMAPGVYDMTFNVLSSTHVQATTPARDPTRGPYQIRYDNAQADVNLGWADFGYLGAPVVSGFNPPTGPLAGGTAVAINGEFLTGATAVSFGANPATFSVASDGVINATTPAGAGVGPVTVTVVTPLGTATGTFSYTATPTVSVTPAPDGRGWQWLTCWRGPPANRGQLVSNLIDIRSRKVHFDLYGPATAECVIDGRNPAAASLAELSQDLVVYRWNAITAAYECIFRGPIGHTQDTISETVHTVNVQAADYRAMWNRLISPATGQTTFSQQDQAVIAKSFVTLYGGAGGDPALDQGARWDGVYNADGTRNSDATTGVLRDRTYSGAVKAGDTITQLAAVINGFDWGMEPVDPAAGSPGSASPAALARIWYPQRGVTKAFIAEWGVSVASLSRTADSNTFANWIRMDGKNDASGNPIFATSRGDAYTNPQLHPEGVWMEGTSSPDISVLTTLQQQCDGALAIDSILTPAYSLVLVPGAWQQKSDCWLGDTIEVRVKSGRLSVDTQVRIVQVDYAVDDDGNEQISLTVVRAVPTLSDLFSDQRSQLNALSRR